MNTQKLSSFYEFFCGGGMVRAGLGGNWECLFANDFDFKKSASYQANWGENEIRTADVKTITTSDLPAGGDLAWASFPCQDLSLAGGGAGLKGERSGTFWPFWDLMKSLIKENRAPKLIVLENVCGTLTSHGGKDFKAICSELSKSGYKFGALVADAVHFVPQSRPRLFIIAVHKDCQIPSALLQDAPSPTWHTTALKNAYQKMTPKSLENCVWWNLPIPKNRPFRFADLVEDNPSSTCWHTPVETKKLLDMMSPINYAKVEAAKKTNKKIVGTIYKRTRLDENGRKVQRAEVRFDEIAGCLRTPAGGSSRQLIIIVEGNSIKSRLISTRETARLMGLADTYILPERYNEAYHLTGDGVAVPVVRYLAKNIFEPLLTANKLENREAA